METEASAPRRPRTARGGEARTLRISRVVAANRLRFSVAHLYVHAPPLRAGLDALGRIEAEDVLGAELVLDVGVDAAELRRLLDVVRVAACLAAEAAQFVARVDLAQADADADRVDRDGGAAGVLDRLLE